MLNNLINYPHKNLVNKENHSFDDLNKLCLQTVTNIINQIVEYDIHRLRSRYKLEFLISDFRRYVDRANYLLRNLINLRTTLVQRLKRG